jgi:hypothetical protein
VDRFFKTFGILIVMLFILASGIDATLGRLASSPRQSQLALYGANSRELQVCTGDVNRLAEAGKIDTTQMPRFLLRAKRPGFAPLPDSGSGWL